MCEMGAGLGGYRGDGGLREGGVWRLCWAVDVWGGMGWGEGQRWGLWGAGGGGAELGGIWGIRGAAGRWVLGGIGVRGAGAGERAGGVGGFGAGKGAGAALSGVWGLRGEEGALLELSLGSAVSPYSVGRNGGHRGRAVV